LSCPSSVVTESGSQSSPRSETDPKHPRAAANDARDPGRDVRADAGDSTVPVKMPLNALCQRRSVGSPSRPNQRTPTAQFMTRSMTSTQTPPHLPERSMHLGVPSWVGTFGRTGEDRPRGLAARQSSPGVTGRFDAESVAGIELINVQGGGDFEVAPERRIGPFAGLTVAEYLDASNSVTTGSFSIESSGPVRHRAVHEWLVVRNMRATRFLDGRPCSDRHRSHSRTLGSSLPGEAGNAHPARIRRMLDVGR
jgi:hypothetical protein